MATYLIGDVQGCYLALKHLLDAIDYEPGKDQLGFVGDLVNRGPHSLEVLRLIRSLQPEPLVVLGNHDLYLLILGYGMMAKDRYTHTLEATLHAPDVMDHLKWLRQQPFVRKLPSHNTIMVHAGIPPQWTISDALAFNDELTETLQSHRFKAYLKNVFGNQPNQWKASLSGIERLRYLTNAFTRMRRCNKNGDLALDQDETNEENQKNYKPWFSFRRHDTPFKIAFGHWAALQGQCPVAHIHALDTGCVWGHKLTAIRLEDERRFSVPAHRPICR